MGISEKEGAKNEDLSKVTLKSTNSQSLIRVPRGGRGHNPPTPTQCACLPANVLAQLM